MPAPLARWQAERVDRKLAVVSLMPFDMAAVAELLDTIALPGLQSAAWADSLHKLTGGFAFDLLNTLMAMQSQGVQDFGAGPRLLVDATRPPDATLARLQCLPDEARRLAQIAAIAGQDLDVDLAAGLLHLPRVAIAAPWKLLLDARVFGDHGFAHELFHRAVATSIPAAVARTLHRDVAHYLETTSRDAMVTTAARIALHWEAAGRWADAGRQYERAAEAACLRSARREELNALADGARCFGLAGPEQATDAFRCACQRVRKLPGLEALDSALAAADALLGEAIGDEQRAAALEARSVIHGERYESEAALADAREAMVLTGDARVRLLATKQAARSLLRLSRHDEALALLDMPAEALAALDVGDQIVWLAETATALDYADRRTEAIAAFDRAIARGRGAQAWEGVNAAQNDQAIALAYANRLEESTAVLRQALDSGRRAGLEDDGLLMETMTLSANLRDLGRFDEALQIAEPLPSRLRNAGYAAWSHNTENDLVGLFLCLGRPELARRAMTPLADDAPEVIRAARLFTEARMLRESANAVPGMQPGELVRRASKLLAEAGGSGRSYVRLKIALEIARDETGDIAIAKTTEIEAEARHREHAMLAVQARLLRVKLLLGNARTDAAAEAALGLVDIECAVAIYMPELWWTAAQALETADRALANRCLDSAAAWIADVAVHRVPEVFQRSFLTRNRVNVAVLAAQRRRGTQGDRTGR